MTDPVPRPWKEVAPAVVGPQRRIGHPIASIVPFVVAGLLFLWGRPLFGAVVAGIGVTLILLRLAAPTVHDWILSRLGRFAGWVGKWVAAVLLTLIYGIVFTPIALIRRLLRIDTLQLRPVGSSASLWSSPTHAETARLFGRPFLLETSDASRARKTMRLVARLSFASIIILGVGELGLRLLWHNPYRHESPDRMLKLRMHHPRTDHIYDRSLIAPDQSMVRLRTDDRSYILPSFRYSTPDATVAFLGGSTTECGGIGENLRFPALVSELLAQRGHEVNTLNIARSGNTLHDSLNVLLNHVVDDKPDFVVAMHASNDIGVLNAAKGYRSRQGEAVSVKDLAAWSLQLASSELYLSALARYRLTAPRPTRRGWAGDWRRTRSFVDELEANKYRQRLRALVRICRAFEIQPILMTQPFSGDINFLTPEWVNATAQDQFNEIIREIGREEGVEVIDLVHHIRDRAPDSDGPVEIFYDGIHVTDQGSRVYARHIADRLLPLIVERGHTETDPGSFTDP